jgi:hypothetical protein
MQEVSRNLLEKLLTNYDPDIDISSGSPADLQIIQPLLDRLDPDPLEVPFVDFAKTLLTDRFSSLSFEEGDALAEAVIKPSQFIMRPLLDQAIIIIRNQSLQNWTEMGEEELDSLLANFFFTREEGSHSVGTSRIYFSSPVSVTVGTGNVFTSKTGLRFIPTLPQSIAADTMLTNKEGNYYYFDVFLMSENPGTDYNIGVGDIVSVTGIIQAVSVTNKRKFINGTSKDTDEEAVQAAQLSISERSITTLPGTVTRLSEDIPAIDHIRVIGFGDEEMTRDVVRGGGAGAIVAWGADAYLINDDDGDKTTQYITTYNANFLTAIGPVGSVTDTWVISFNGVDYTVDSVIDQNTIKVTSEISLEEARSNIVSLQTDLETRVDYYHVESPGVDFATTAVMVGHVLEVSGGFADDGFYYITEVMPTPPSGWAGSNNNFLKLDTPMTVNTTVNYKILFGHPWVLRRNVITLSEIPGGFVYTDDTTIPDDEVHIGGMTDIYISGDVDEQSTTLTAVTDQLPLAEGTDLDYVDTYIVNSASTDFEDLGATAGHVLVIEEGVSAGTYRIVAVSTNTLYLEASLSSFTGVDFHVNDTVDLELTDPREERIDGTDGKVTLGTSNFTTAALTAFTDFSVVAGDYLEILAGPDEGDHLISSVSGVGGSVLVVDHSFSTTQSDLSYTVYRKLDVVETPIVSVSNVELLDTNDEPTGVYVPYGKPIDSRAVGVFTNIGEGIDEEFLDVSLGLTSADKITTPVTNINGKDLALRIDAADTLSTVTFSGASLSAEDIRDQINDVVPDIAYLKDVGGDKYLLLQSVNRQITVDHLSVQQVQG